ncbi:MAG: GAP family protein [Actinomycetota bacterium]|nr:GAP family protein [Actinomycetota bacterium]
MDLSLWAEVAGLGLAAVDAIGLAFMPILLAQANGLRRALVFLLGSFLALMTVGMLFTAGLGARVADLNLRHPWLEPGVQVAGGIFLVGAGIFMLLRSRTGGSHAPDDLVEKLRLPMPLLFGFGVLLVTVQSLVDVVFAVAMVEIGAQGLSFFQDFLLVLTYAVCALLLQSAVVVGYLLVPAGRRVRVMARFTEWLGRRGEFWAGIAGLVVGLALLFFSVPELARELNL